MKPIPSVSTNLFTCFQFYNSSLLLSEKATHKIIVIYLSQKANTLAIFPTGTGKPGFQSYLPNFIFHQMPNGKHQLRHLQVIYLCKKIGLVFYRIFGCTQPGFPA